ncbi:Fungal_trans domain-containing protein [Fusarium acuminatum]|uniref:Fungal_trans domain-containing protein n=1 Tax=Fusarium acuminatum TaxID=5515 RepID=A0ABZ2X5V6_9HYPO
MKSLILKVVLGKKCVRKVGSVEGLLLLGEWTLHNQDQVDDGDEASAWSIIGLAVRLAYLLRLEESGFKSDDAELQSVHRERLVWTFTYLSDRQISIRMGQAFWCRGPALSARFTARDFPALQPTRSRDEDFASFIQAQVELTTLFGNAHDILFASRSRTAELMMRGDYTKYVDDTTKAMYAWQHAWTSLAVSPHLKSCLNLMQEYLRLYVNAFAFQAVIYRASVNKDSNSDLSDGSRSRGSKMFPDSAMASPDARHIYEAADAAEALIRIVTDDIHPEKYLRYMPARFYLYEIHSSVFLYKAHACGAISSGNHTHITSLMERFISVLKAAAVDDKHIAAAYAKLLDRLWFRRTHGLSMSDITNDNTELDLGDQEVTNSPPTLATDTNMSQISFFDDFGFQPLEYTDVMDGLFSMPFVASWDPTTFPNIIA